MDPFLSVSSVALSDWMLSDEVDDFVDVALKWRALDAVGGEQFLCLAGVVELLDEEVRYCVMRQTRDLW